MEGDWNLAGICFSVPLSLLPLELAPWKRREVGKVLLELFPSLAGFSTFWVRQKFEYDPQVSGVFMGS